MPPAQEHILSNSTASAVLDYPQLVPLPSALDSLTGLVRAVVSPLPLIWAPTTIRIPGTRWCCPFTRLQQPLPGHLNLVTERSELEILHQLSLLYVFNLWATGPGRNAPKSAVYTRKNSGDIRSRSGGQSEMRLPFTGHQYKLRGSRNAAPYHISQECYYLRVSNMLRILHIPPSVFQIVIPIHLPKQIVRIPP